MKKALIILITVLLSVSMFTGCKNEPKVYTVTFDANGGTGTIDPQTVVENEKATKPTTVPTHTGWGLIGWSTTKDGTTAFDFDKNAITADITLYAMWQKTYTVGGKGPAGGYIFYDVDADNNETQNDGLTSEKLGWRYLEAAPADLEGTYVFGFYRVANDGTNSTVETKEGTGEGKANTKALVEAMGETTYTEASGETKGTYAAKACDDYTYGGYDDWFLPSMYEVCIMYNNLFYKKEGGTWQSDSYYWSSSEVSGTTAYQVKFDPESRRADPLGRNDSVYVRAIRMF